MTNPDVKTSDCTEIKKETIGIRWNRIIDGRNLALHDLLTIENYGRQMADFPISFTFRSAFEDLYTEVQ